MWMGSRSHDVRSISGVGCDALNWSMGPRCCSQSRVRLRFGCCRRRLTRHGAQALQDRLEPGPTMLSFDVPPYPLDARGAEMPRAAGSNLAGDLVGDVLGAVLDVAGGLLGVALEFLGLALGLELVVAGRVADALLHVADGLVGEALDL